MREELKDSHRVKSGRNAIAVQRIRRQIAVAVESRLAISLKNPKMRSRALLWSLDHSIRVACTVSKCYAKGSTYHYWYAYHPKWDQFLRECDDAYLILGLMDRSIAL